MPTTIQQQINAVRRARCKVREHAERGAGILKDAENTLISIKLIMGDPQKFAKDFTAHHEKHGAYNHSTTIGEDVVNYLKQRGLGL